MKERSVPIMGLLLIVAMSLLYYSISVGLTIGAEWYSEKATHQWHMNNYFVIDGIYAYNVFGLASVVIGGLFTGLALSTFWVHNKTLKQTLLQGASFFAAIILSGLGFNTLNFMLGSFYWTNMQYPPPVAVPVLGSVDVWNFYFFLFVVPLWTGGLFFGLLLIRYACFYRPYKMATNNVSKRLTSMVYQNKEYLAESTMVTRRGSQISLSGNSSN